jgi:hypothetical protein
MVSGTRTHNKTKTAIAHMARTAAKLILELEAAGLPEAAHRIRETADSAIDAIRASAPARAPVASAPVLTAEQILAAASARGVTAFGPGALEQKVLLASLGLDLGRAEVRAGLVDLHQRGEIHLARIDVTLGARASLAERGFDVSFLDASEIRTPNGSATFHAVFAPVALHARGA